MPSDPTGASTFGRFRWQAKIAVLIWLEALSDSGPRAVVCEHVEDLAVVESTGFRFAQLKTRDKGSWSVAKVCADGHAIDSLVKAYELAETAGIVGLSRFEVLLEGPPSEDRKTTDFFRDPTTAGPEIRRRIRDLGLARGKVDDFLGRLAIRCHQPSRTSVDAVIIRLIGATWPAMSMEEVERLYETLLQATEAAQSDSEPPSTVRAAMIAARVASTQSQNWAPIERQALTNDQLRALCPPIEADTDATLVARAARGGVTLLELKLARAGAGRDTVQGALLARADAEVAAVAGRASGLMTAEVEQSLDVRLLETAGSLARLAASSGLALRRPAEYIFNSLMSRAADTAALDVEGIYGRDHRLVVGHLCGVSDRCRYGWGVS